MALPPQGKVFGRYTLTRELGRGGMGVVFQARDARLDREVALKMLLDPHAPAEATARFQREARAAAKLEHPNIIKVHEVGVEGGRAYFTMAFVRGKPLNEAIEGLPLARRVELVRDVTRALDFAHRNGIIHRDVKPANIIVAEDGTPILMDFGLARPIGGASQLTATGILMGTPNFMSPEQAREVSDSIDGRSDVFAMGSVFYFVLTGVCAFERDTMIKTIHAVVHDVPIPPSKINPEVPEALEVICLKALEKRPADRFETAGAMADDLDRFLRGESILAQPPGGLTISARWFKRHAVAAVLGAVAVAAIVVAVIAFSRNPGGDDGAAKTALEASAAKERDRVVSASRLAAASDKVRAGRDKMALADQCRMAGNAENLSRALQAAVEQFDAALKVAPELAEARAERGRALAASGLTDRALADLDTALASDAPPPLAFYERGKIRVAQFIDRATIAAAEGDAGSESARAAREIQKSAADDLAKAASLDAGPGREWVKKHAEGALAFLAGDRQGALAALNIAIEASPFLDEALSLRAQIRSQAGETDEALKDLDRAVQANAFNAHALQRRGVLHFNRNELAAAIQDFDAALTVAPDLWLARLNRGRARAAMSDPIGAIRDYDAVLAADPTNRPALADRAEARLATKEYEKAEADLTAAIAVAPSPRLFARRAAACRLAGKLDAALEDTSRSGDFPEGALERGLALEGLNRGGEASPVLQAFLDGNPDHPRAGEAREALQRIGAK